MIRFSNQMLLAIGLFSMAVIVLLGWYVPVGWPEFVFYWGTIARFGMTVAVSALFFAWITDRFIGF